MENIHDEAILGMLSEINKKVDTVVSVVKTIPSAQTPVEADKPSITKEEVGKIITEQVQNLGNFIGQKYSQEIEKLNVVSNGIVGLKRQLEQISLPEQVSLEDIATLFPKPKKIAFFGFEFLRSSVVIFVLALFLFWSAVLNIRQADKYRTLQYRYSEQYEHIRQMQTTIEKQADTKTKDEKPKKKSK